MRLVISDLDGTLLDHDTYSFAEALPAIERLRTRGIPLILCSSKTRAEMEVWRARIGNRDPFIVENGGAVCIPGEAAVVLGARYAELVRVLAEASAESGCRVTGFNGMSVKEVAAACGMDAGAAALAKQREYDEPFVVLDAARECALLAAIEARGKRWTRGGRFHHIIGNSDKAAAVRILVDRYRQQDPEVATIGLGDGLNDAAFLNAADTAVLIPSPWLEALRAAVPRGTAARHAGPQGWNEAILRLVE